MKKYYEEPNVVIDEFRVEEVVLTSGKDNTGEGGTEIVNPFGNNPVG